jgi:peptide/nickel transport system permease protein
MSELTVPLPNTEVAPSSTPNVSERKQARRETWHLLRRRPSFIVGSAIIAFWTFCAFFGNMVAPFNPRKPTRFSYRSPNSTNWFGTDQIGQDVFSRVITGARDVLKNAPLAALLGVVAGVILGMFMGYLGGWFDTVASRLVEALLSLPSILIGLLAITTLGRSNTVVIGVFAFLFTPIVARTVRAAVQAERDLDYVTSAKLRGESPMFIMFREILPNVTGPIIVEATIRIGYAIFVIATLSFLRNGACK